MTALRSLRTFVAPGCCLIPLQGTIQQRPDGLFNIGKSLERTVRSAVLLAIGEQLPFGKHHIRLIHGESIGEPIAHEDDGTFSFSEAPTIAIDFTVLRMPRM